MKQKFPAYSFVRVSDKMPDYMSHFEKGFDAIVDGSYSQLFGGDSTDEYSLYQIKDGKVVNNISWYEEDQLTLLTNHNYPKAQEMVEDYNCREKE